MLIKYVRELNRELSMENKVIQYYILESEDYMFNKMYELNEQIITKYNMFIENMDTLFFYVDSLKHNPRETIKTTRMKNTCSICMKKHNRNKAIRLSCTHEFGSKCFNKWCETCIASRNKITCPLCKKENV